jgi:prepilin-type N-terminal cleavage/methylation domain-containing protein
MKAAIRSPGGRAAFTLVELMTVIAVIALLMGIVIASATYASRQSDRKKALADMHRLRMETDRQRLNSGRYPSYAGYVTNDVFATNLSSAVSLKDPWGKSFYYSTNESPYTCTISSDGPDRVRGTADDLVLDSAAN